MSVRPTPDTAPASPGQTDGSQLPDGHVPPFGVPELLAVLRLERIERNHFRAGHGPGAHVFGGQVLAQAILSASATVEDFELHSLHSYFLLRGDSSRPILFEVERIRDGRSFATRRVIGVQRGRAIFSLSASFQRPEVGLEHQTEVDGELPSPEDLPEDLEHYRALMVDDPSVRRFAFRYQAVDARQVEGIHMMPREGRPALPPAKKTWVRLREPLSASDAARLGATEGALHAACIAYISDMDFMSTTLLPHGGDLVGATLQGASLDHSMWFHRPVRADDWLLFSKQSPSAGHGRGLVRGEFRDRQGRLVLSAQQECLIRVREPS